MNEHLLLVTKDILAAYQNGCRTQHIAIDYGLWVNPIKTGDLFRAQTTNSEPRFTILEIRNYLAAYLRRPLVTGCMTTLQTAFYDLDNPQIGIAAVTERRGK